MPDDPHAVPSIEDIMLQDNTWWIVLTLAPVLIFYLLFCIGVGIIAKTKGRSFWGWALLSLPITPIICGLIVFVMETRPIYRKPPQPM